MESLIYQGEEYPVDAVFIISFSFEILNNFKHSIFFSVIILTYHYFFLLFEYKPTESIFFIF